MRTKPILALYLVVLFWGCKKETPEPISPSETNSSLKSSCRIASINYDDEYSTFFEYDDSGFPKKITEVSILSSGNDTIITNLKLEKDSVKLSSYSNRNTQFSSNILIINSDRNIIRKKRVDSSDDHYYEYDSNGYLIKEFEMGDTVFYKFLNGNMVSSVSSYGKSKRDTTTYEYYLDKLNTSNLDARMQFDLITGKATKNLIKKTATKKPDYQQFREFKYSFNKDGYVSKMDIINVYKYNDSSPSDTSHYQLNFTYSCK